MNKRIIAAAVSLILLAGCAGGTKDTAVTTNTVNTVQDAQVSETEAAAPETETAETEAAEGDASAETSLSDSDSPYIYEDFTSDTAIMGRGPATAEIVDDDKASDGKALYISGRTDAWNGAQYDSEIFRGNEIEVSGSFRSGNSNVKVTIQFDILGNTTYNPIFAVKTNEDSYSKGSGKFEVPDNAENILVYIESDNTGDIYADDISVKVVGEYKKFDKPAGLAYVDTSDYPSLRELYSEQFLIGTCINPKVIATPEYSELVKAQFSSVTCENDMKPESLLDRTESISDLDKYQESPAINFDRARDELDFARDNGIKLRAHTLVWHSQTPDWLFYKDYDTSGELADRELMLKRMENYIKSVMEWTNENYPGLIYAWDVVNEAIDDGGGIRKSLWYETIGDDYIYKAFEFARKYAPADAKLFYNDYNSYMLKKQSDILEYIRPVAEAGNIDGIGMQSHLNTDVSLSLYFIAMKRYYEELGLEIQVTELDIGRKGQDNWRDVQGDYYRDYMKRLIEAKNEGVPVTCVTVWGLSDGMSWRANELPLLFDADLSRKPAFDGMVEAAE